MTRLLPGRAWVASVLHWSLAPARKTRDARLPHSSKGEAEGAGRMTRLEPSWLAVTLVARPRGSNP